MFNLILFAIFSVLRKFLTNVITSIIESGNREMAGKTLPPQGLYLVKVEY